jgi:hypothetical protein
MTFTLQKDDVSPALAVLRARAKNPRRIMAAAAGGIANLFRKHLRMLNRTHPNKLGGKRTHMWNEFARSVNIPQLTDTSATISISDPRAQHKHTGGTIRAKRTKMLAIPVTAEAYGRRPSVFEGETGIKLFVLRGENSAALAGATEGGVKVFFALKASVTQGPDPKEGILPPEDEIKTVALAKAQEALARQLKM